MKSLSAVENHLKDFYFQLIINSLPYLSKYLVINKRQMRFLRIGIIIIITAALEDWIGMKMSDACKKAISQIRHTTKSLRSGSG